MTETAIKEKSDSLHIIRGILLIVFITLGLVGNTVMIIVFTRVEHRTKTISYLMINLGIANIIICALGYPVAVAYNLKDLQATMGDSFRCGWLGFTTATTGIACVLTLTLTSVTQYRVITKMTVRSNLENRLKKWHIGLQITAIWVTAIALSIPPIFGWNRFVPVQSGVSCHPDWASQDPTDKAYIWFLVSGGFFIPLTVICCSYGMTYRFMHRLSVGQIQGKARNMRLAQQKKVNRKISVVILAFILSWSPYCLVSLISNFTGRHVMSPGVSVVPQLMAKSSVVYSPLIDIYFNRTFRATLLRLIWAFFSFFLTVFCYHRKTQPETPVGLTDSKTSIFLLKVRKTPCS